MRSRGLTVTSAVVLMVGLPSVAQASDGVRLGTGTVPDAVPGSIVHAYLSPSDPHGPKRIKLKLVATGAVERGGRFVLRAADSRRLASESHVAGSASLVAYVRTRSGVSEAFFSTKVSRSHGEIAAAPATSGTAAAPKIEMQPLKMRVSAASRRDCRDQGDVGAPVRTRTNLYKEPTVVGELNNAYPDTRGSFLYESRADTSITPAFNASGDPGAWRLTHSVSKSNSVATRVGPVGVRGPYSYRVVTNFFYGKYRYDLCPAPRSASRYYRIVPLLWDGGGGRRHQGGTLGVCTGGNDYGPNFVFSRSKNKATVWKRPVEVAGVSLSARSGFSRTVRLHYEFGDRLRSYRLCGNGGRSERVAGRVFSGAGRAGT